jgi:hypothetical protein
MTSFEKNSMNVIQGDHWVFQDHTYAATYSKQDGETIKRLLATAKRLKNNWILNPVHGGMHKRLEGEYVDTNSYFEPIQVEHKIDKVQVAGMEIFNQNIMHESTTLFNWMAVGSGTAQTFENQTIMQSEVNRDDCLLHGYMRAEGLFLMWDNIYDITLPSFTCTEIGLFSAESGGTMGARAVLANGIPHSNGNDYIYVQYFIVTMSA